MVRASRAMNGRQAGSMAVALLLVLCVGLSGCASGRAVGCDPCAEPVADCGPCPPKTPPPCERPPEAKAGEAWCQVWVPPGFAHGFVVLSDTADFLYKTTDYYAPEHEHCIKWNDPQLGIDWQYAGMPIVSEKDARGVPFREAAVFG